MRQCRWYYYCVLVTLVQKIKFWRLLETLLHVAIVGVLLVAVALLYAGVESTLYEIILVATFAALLVCWYLISGLVHRNLQTAIDAVQYKNRQEFDSLYERSPVAYLTVDMKGRVLRANPSAAHTFGDTLTDITTRNFFNFINEDMAEDADSILRGKVAAGLTLTDLELPVTTLTGDNRWVLINVFSSEHPDERLINVTDVTDQHAVDTAKSEFVALATHQLRTPIAAIRWNVELLMRTMRESKTEKQDKYLTKINRNVMRMLNLINDFLSVSQLEMGTYTAERETVNFAEYLDGILDEFEEKVLTKQLTIQKVMQPDTFTAAIDNRLFHIISSNLISNAVKYTPAGGTVTVTARAGGGTLFYSVADTGIGIPEDEQQEMFTKFFRASNAKANVTEGTGLGLYVVKQSVEILGGTLTMESVENEGTTFHVELPNIVQ